MDAVKATIKLVNHHKGAPAKLATTGCPVEMPRWKFN
jgi:hypothetical protein